jgi:hypothetical protein
MFRPISQRFTTRQVDLEKKNSKQEVLNVVVSTFLKDNLGITNNSVQVSLERGNLYISTPHKALANEIVFKARSLYSLLKQHHIVCNNLVIR